MHRAGDETAVALRAAAPSCESTPRVPTPILVGMRLSHFWNRMYEQFGETYAESLARDYVIDALGSRTVQQALADGIGAKEVWRAVCDTFDLPSTVR
ncbi:hypothetical protein NOGI109294_05390 [Nocardiopsis gilva]